MPNDHHVTRLLIEDYHQRMGHQGMSSTWTDLRQSYWILKGTATVRNVLGKCLFCRRRNARPGVQMMADLPKERLTPNKPPFYFTGVDYFGSFLVRQGRSDVKRYGCIFTCFTTRAMHLEVAHSLTADSFIAALSRFTSRRGKPYCIFSDNGTNFVGAEKELSKSIEEWNKNQICAHLQQNEIGWEFKPPQASNMGGIWERMIRSIRKIMHALLSEQSVPRVIFDGVDRGGSYNQFEATNPC